MGEVILPAARGADSKSRNGCATKPDWSISADRAKKSEDGKNVGRIGAVRALDAVAALLRSSVALTTTGRRCARRLAAPSACVTDD